MAVRRYRTIALLGLGLTGGAFIFVSLRRGLTAPALCLLAVAIFAALWETAGLAARWASTKPDALGRAAAKGAKTNTICYWCIVDMPCVAVAAWLAGVPALGFIGASVLLSLGYLHSLRQQKGPGGAAITNMLLSVARTGFIFVPLIHVASVWARH